jgi:peptidoglycan/xylan/chitin deacetylase (PgdA/CDA1 family)
LAALLVAATALHPVAGGSNGSSLERDPTDSLRVPVLVYHNVAPHRIGETRTQATADVTPETFEAQMAYLREHGVAVVPLQQLVAALKGRAAVQEPAVVIAFDDGWEGQYRHAFPILRRFGYTATFFIITDAVGKDDYMTWDQLRELRRAGMTIGSHSRTHRVLTAIRDRCLLDDEIAGSRRVLESELRAPVAFFAYPFGAQTPSVLAAVRDAGYQAARGFPGGAWNRAADIWTLRSVGVTDDLPRFARLCTPPMARAGRP